MTNRTGIRKLVESGLAMESLLDSLGQVFTGLWGVLNFFLASALPWLGILAWIAFWLFAVNWLKLGKVLAAGGWVGVVLIGFVMVIVWGAIAPPESGKHYLLGLTVSNFVGKTVYVTALLCIMMLCGSVQRSGVLGDWCRFDEHQPDEHAHHGHHDSHGGHHEAHAAHH